jgi:thiamine biosynthesis protein ThiS
MQITVNGKAREVKDGVTVLGLLEELALTAGPVAVEINRAIVPRATHPSHVVQAGDAIEIVHFVGGG